MSGFNVLLCECWRKESKKMEAFEMTFFFTHTVFDYSSLNGATQIQEFPDLKGTTSLEIMWVSYTQNIISLQDRMWKNTWTVVCKRAF